MKHRLIVLFTLFVFIYVQWCPIHVVFLFCFFSSCLLYVASFSGLSFFDYPSVFSNIYLVLQMFISVDTSVHQMQKCMSLYGLYDVRYSSWILNSKINERLLDVVCCNYIISKIKKTINICISVELIKAQIMTHPSASEKKRMETFFFSKIITVRTLPNLSIKTMNEPLTITSFCRTQINYIFLDHLPQISVDEIHF